MYVRETNSYLTLANLIFLLIKPKGFEELGYFVLKISFSNVLRKQQAVTLDKLLITTEKDSLIK